VDDPSAYRPLCMLDVVGKLFERIVCNRLEEELEERSGISDWQFGFRKKRSTVDAIKAVVEIASNAIEGERWKGGKKRYCLVTTLDVRNAFNSASWPSIMNALHHLRISEYIVSIVSSYFRDRVLLYDTSCGRLQHRISGGVPQGSVLGPTLWNVMYDAVLRLPTPPGTRIVGFADDIAIVAVAKELRDVETSTNVAIEQVICWLASNSLSLAAHKTEAVLISSRKAVECATIEVAGCTITSKPAIKYLGIQLDHRLTFKYHLDYAASKATKATTALAGIMANVGGPRQRSRWLISNVVRSIILYAAPIWAPAMSVKAYGQTCKAAYRTCALRVLSAFRTVSEDAALVLAGMIPLDLLADETRYNGSAAVKRETTLMKWQERWRAATNGSWTRRIVPDIRPWVSRKYGQTDYYLTQLLTGHGCFKSYLYRFNHETNPFCTHCAGVIEDAEHVLFVCPRYSAEREELSLNIGRNFIVTDFIDILLSSQNNWVAVTHMAADIMKSLRRAERQRNSNSNSR